MALFASRLESEILAEVPHRQYVFTIPKLLRLHFRFDRQLLGLLSNCAYHSVLEMMQTVVADQAAGDLNDPAQRCCVAGLSDATCTTAAVALVPHCLPGIAPLFFTAAMRPA